MVFPKDKQIPPQFNHPTKLPETALMAQDWQEANRSFWESFPMRYDWNDKNELEPFSKEFYRKIDSTFFNASEEFFPVRKLPFDSLIPFDDLNHFNTLEIGIGNGSHAQLLASHSASFTGIDLTESAVLSTQKRLSIYGLKGTIIQMDAENLDFSGETFDFIWSWGVIHHSSDTERILAEVHRVLKTGGGATLMVYHRGWWNYYLLGAISLLKNIKSRKLQSLHSMIQQRTDGGLARYYKVSEFKNILEKNFRVRNIFTIGPKSDVIALPRGILKEIVRKILPSLLSIFLTKQLRMGSFLVVEVEKIDSEQPQF